MIIISLFRSNQGQYMPIQSYLKSSTMLIQKDKQQVQLLANQGKSKRSECANGNEQESSEVDYDAMCNGVLNKFICGVLFLMIVLTVVHKVLMNTENQIDSIQIEDEQFNGNQHIEGVQDALENVKAQETSTSVKTEEQHVGEIISNAKAEDVQALSQQQQKRQPEPEPPALLPTNQQKDANQANAEWLKSRFINSNPNTKNKFARQFLKFNPTKPLTPQNQPPTTTPPQQQPAAAPLKNQQQQHQYVADRIKNYRQKFEANKAKIDLKDFSKDEVYKNAPPEMKDIFDKMIKRPADKKAKPNPFLIPSQKAYFAYRLFQEPENPEYLKAEYYYFDQKYGIGQIKDELPLCVVAPGRNIVDEEKYKRFINSINRQNYTNYKLIYIDDVSNDNSPQVLQNYVKNLNGTMSGDGKLTIVRNTERIYALGNRNKGIRKYCDENDIVLDVDSDDCFIGNQVFKFVNFVFQDPQIWQSNSVFIYIESVRKQVTRGPEDGVPLELLEKNKYRGSMIWKTSELRTFRAKLFNKINENDFKDKNGKFYQWASDAFMQEPLIELAGPKHYKHYYEIMYFYDWSLDWSSIYKRRHFRDVAWTQTPYKPLLSLDAEAEKVDDYEISSKMKAEFAKNVRLARKQAMKYKKQIPSWAIENK